MIITSIPSYLYLPFGVVLVVWNPWIEKAKGMGDFGDEEYHEMVCVEAGSVAQWVRLEGGQSWTGGQTLTVA
ncbi:hypothetical protein [Absidia glauca]|uniref:Uncharacterized protein n=1 Tax=Absidia glauca TaxID=4829 RepID=A0A168QVR0_ABSGL|nr:hypothetical protein [Absidia glauca]